MEDAINEIIQIGGGRIDGGLIQKCMSIAYMPKDGNCMFNAISFSMLSKLGPCFAKEYLHDKKLGNVSNDLRHRVAVHLGGEELVLKDEFRSFIYDNEEGVFSASHNEYVRKLYDGRIYGGHIELTICSDILKTCIIVLRPSKTEFIVSIVGKDFYKTAGACLYLHLKNLHYDSLILNRLKPKS